MNGQVFAQLLRLYGHEVELCPGGDEDSAATRAFVQPILDRSGGHQTVPSPMGRVRQDRFLYLGDPEASLEKIRESGWVIWNGGCYDIQAAQPVYVGEQVSHWWAILRPRDEEGR